MVRACSWLLSLVPPSPPALQLSVLKNVSLKTFTTHHCNHYLLNKNSKQLDKCNSLFDNTLILFYYWLKNQKILLACKTLNYVCFVLTLMFAEGLSVSLAVQCWLIPGSAPLWENKDSVTEAHCKGVGTFCCTSTDIWIQWCRTQTPFAIFIDIQIQMASVYLQLVAPEENKTTK